MLQAESYYGRPCPRGVCGARRPSGQDSRPKAARRRCVTLTLDPAGPAGTPLSPSTRPVFGAASFSLALHFVLVSLMLMVWANRSAGPSGISQFVSAEKLIWIGEG